MSGRKSREKGKRGEREAASIISKYLGAKVRRGQQFTGSPDSPDVVGLKKFGLHPEIKRDEITISKRVQRELDLWTPALGVYKGEAYIIMRFGSWPTESQLGMMPTVKLTKSMVNAVNQAYEDAGKLTPFVMARRSRSPWYVIVKADDYAAFRKKIKGARQKS